MRFFPEAIIFLLFLLYEMASSRYSKDNRLPLPINLNLDTGLTCRLVAGLTRVQRDVCHNAPDTAAVAFEGLQMAVRECQHQFRWNRWNCSSLSVKSANPHASAIMKRGFRETSFLYALTAAGVAHAIARACAQGHLLSCNCDPRRYRSSHDDKWQWSGCSHNLPYGIEFSTKFLDVREEDQDLQSKINVHNNNAGRLILASHMEVRCKCHGLSGSCQLRTCWLATPDFRVVATAIKRKYRKALMVAQKELNKHESSKAEVLVSRPRTRHSHDEKKCKRARPAPTTSLVYFEKSPSFCEADNRLDYSSGTAGRVCRSGHSSRGSCDLLCCGRGYDLVKKTQIKPCNCVFKWCCNVECQKCAQVKWIALCN